MHGISTTSRNAEFRTHYTYYTELPYILNLKKSGITLVPGTLATFNELIILLRLRKQ